MRWLIAALLLVPACNFHRDVNAPGTQPYLDQPFPHERGLPGEYQVAGDPGIQWIGIVPAAYFGGGLAGGEWSGVAGMQVEVSRGSWPYSGSGGAEHYPHSRTGLTFGWDIREGAEGSSRPGALYVEATRQYVRGRSDGGRGVGISAGLVTFPTVESFDAGVQVSLSAGFHWPSLVLRARYTADSGPAAFLSYQVAFPSAVVWSQ